jgi:hypothetical protein
MRVRRLSAISAAEAIVCATVAGTANAAIPAQWKNRAHVNRTFPHGLGKVGAHDRTTSGAPVTNFKRSTRLYRIAMSYNRGLDRDKDGIACEKL